MIYGFSKEKLPESSRVELLEYAKEMLAGKKVNPIRNSTGSLRLTCEELTNNVKFDNKNLLVDHYRPNHKSECRSMIQSYEKGWIVPPHIDGDFTKIVIINLLGEGVFKLERLEATETQKVGPNDIIIMEHNAILARHSVSNISSFRINMILRYYNEAKVTGSKIDPCHEEVIEYE